MEGEGAQRRQVWYLNKFRKNKKNAQYYTQKLASSITNIPSANKG